MPNKSCTNSFIRWSHDFWTNTCANTQQIEANHFTHHEKLQITREDKCDPKWHGTVLKSRYQICITNRFPHYNLLHTMTSGSTHQLTSTLLLTYTHW